MNAHDNSNAHEEITAEQAPEQQLHKFAVHDGGGVTSLPAAPKGQRFIAAILDGFFAGVLSALGSTLIVKGLHADTAAVKALWGLLFPFMYTVFPLYASGQTLGKKLMKLKVVHVDPTQEPSMGRLILREFPGKGISALCFMLGYIRILRDPDRRAWYDNWAHTRVVTIVEE